MKNKVLIIGINSLVGRSIEASLKKQYKIVGTAGHSKVEAGYTLPIEEPDQLLKILDKEQPDIVVSTIRGDFKMQLGFHQILAKWIAANHKKLLYISTANVFDGDLSRPHIEDDLPIAQSEYGLFKKACEALLQDALSKEQLIIFRISAVWGGDCPRLDQLIAGSADRTKKVATYEGLMVNISWTEQIGIYAAYVLGHDMNGIFHVGTTDLVDWLDFQKKVCDAAGICLPAFEVEKATQQEFQAVLPSRKEIPDELQMTVTQVLDCIRKEVQIC